MAINNRSIDPDEQGLWYKNAILYYMDANGDGVGDFQGLTRRLDYLRELGITTRYPR